MAKKVTEKLSNSVYRVKYSGILKERNNFLKLLAGLKTGSDCNVFGYCFKSMCVYRSMHPQVPSLPF